MADENFDDFFVGGLQIGGYIATERTKQLIPANGQNIFGFGYDKLEEQMSLTEAIDIIRTFGNVGITRSFCVNSRGSFGYHGNFATTITKVDFNDQSSSTSFTTSVATNGFWDSCCNDVGNRVFFLGFATASDDIYCVFTLDAGASWSEVAIDTTTFSTASSPNGADTIQEGLIQCNPEGDKIRVILTMDDAVDLTVVYESTNSATSWTEILLARKALTDPASNAQSEISRDLSTTVIFDDDDHLYISSGGTGALTDVIANFPRVIVAATDRVAISDDGSVVSIFSVTPQQNRIIFDTTNDDGVNWFTQRLDLDLSGEDDQTATVISMFFDPNNAAILYVLLAEGIIYKANINDFSIDRVGLLGANNEAFNTTVTHIQSDFKANNAGFTYGIADAINETKLMAVNIPTGMLILNKISENKAAKIFVGRQTNGEGTFGFDWDRLDSPTVEDILCGYVSADKEDILGGLAGSGGLVLSVNSGVLFTIPTHGFTSGVSSCDGADVAGTLLIAASLGTVRRSTNGGTIWSASLGLTNTGSSLDDIYHVCSCTADGVTVIAAARAGNIDKSTDSGANFSPVGDPTPFSAESNTKLRAGVIAKGNANIIIVGNEGGLIKVSTNGGGSFVNPTTPPVPSLGDDNVFEIDCSSDGSRAVALVGDKIFLSTDTADNWTEIAAGFSESNYRGVSMSDDGNEIFITDGDGVLLRSLEGSSILQKTLVDWSAGRRACKGMAMSPDGTVAYAMTDEGLIYRNS